MSRGSRPLVVPAYALTVSGLLMVIYSVIYAVWSLSVFCLAALALVGALTDRSTGDGDLVVAIIWSTVVPLLQIMGFVVTGLMGGITAVGGLRLVLVRSPGLVWLAVLCSTAAPLLGLAINAASINTACGLGCLTGCLLGNVPTVVLLVLGAGASAAAGIELRSAMRRPADTL